VFRFDFLYKRFTFSGPMVRDGRLENVVRLTGETRARFPAITTARSTWNSVRCDARRQEILFVSNKGHIHGTGGFLAHESRTGSGRVKFTTRKRISGAAGFFADGSRMVYSSYLGRSGTSVGTARKRR